MRPQYGEQHQRASAALIAEHVAAYGWMCPGLEYVEEAHPVAIGALVADHVVAGHPEHGYQVTCRALNTKRMALGLG
jgi:hypothetical protein